MLVALAVALVILVQLALALQWRFGGFASKRVLRVAAPGHEWLDGELTPFGKGFEHELLDRFAENSGMTWTWIRTDSWAEAWTMVKNGRADVVPALGSRPPEALGVEVAAGPVYARTRPVIVHSDKRHGIREDCEVCERPILVTSNPVLTDSLADGAEDLDCTPRTVVSQGLDLTPLLDTLSRNQARFALVDQRRFALWQPFYQGIRPTRSLSRDLEYRWYWSRRSPELAKTLEVFWGDVQKNGALADLYDKYFGFLPKETDRFELRNLTRTLLDEFPRYRETILQAARDNGIDPLLLVAMIYQESRFDSAARSKTGVRGLMQITRATARILGVNRMDPFESIQGGARYLRQLYDGLEGMGLDEQTRWLFALAAYNRGPGHLQDAVDVARALGGQGHSWRELKTAFPKLCYKRWFSRAKYGYTKGYEVVSYVESIRYFRYVLHGLVVLSRPEAQQLAALVGPDVGVSSVL
ncbi:MltF family protein [Desulfocurvus sp. DL9XJH121]